MSDANVVRIDEALKVRYAASTPIVQDLDCQIAPGISVSDEGMDPELARLAGVGLYTRARTQAAGGAGTEARVGLRNPSGSGIIAVVQQIRAWNVLAAQNVQIWAGIEAAIASTTIGGFHRDLSQQGESVCRVLTHASTPAAFQAAGYRGSLGGGGIGTNQSLSISGVPFILPPGFEIFVVSFTQNLDMTAWFSWRERVLTDGERALYT